MNVLSTRSIDAVAVGTMALPLVAAALLWGSLPAEMAIHWNGETPDTVVAKPLATVGLFAFGAASVAFVRIAPDSATSTPGGTTLSVLFLGVTFAWVQATVLVWNLGYRFDVGRAALPILALAGLLVAYAVRSGRF
ncbi:DUF1648 domain-containing protein [Halorubrum sp. SP9]|uniref:DUF1648 domain-containing protein n=1 Tax=Halorubrum sp. SP9 TaxID=1537267 RepID=UPI0010F788F8|nr:DUF1648 domain-containing protein [Halorubrum sp. SP9]TKX67628.1 DUF1648 domain-containing protein [Halorubrum sp. SP9]